MAQNRRDPAHPQELNNSVNTRNSAAFNQSITKNSIYYHKSLDLSNVGLVLNNEDSNDKWLRQFHQTRIYVRDFYKMRHHTQISNGLTSNRNLHIISANLPESVSYRIGSKWDQPLSFGNDASFNLAMQTIGSKFFGEGNTLSGVNRVASLKVWNGSTPLQLSLKIPVIDDGYQVENRRTGLYTNLAEALEFLSCLCLPSMVGKMGFYNPPPSPLNFHGEWSKMSEQYASTLEEGDSGGVIKTAIDFLSKDWKLETEPGHITVQLGGILMLEDVIIESVNVEYPNTKALIRHSYAPGITPGDSGSDYLTPLLAMITINLSTIENLTSDAYSKMLWIKKDQGQGDTNLTDAASALVKGADLLGTGFDAVTKTAKGAAKALDKATGGLSTKAFSAVGDAASSLASSSLSTVKGWYETGSATASDAIQSSSSWLGEALNDGVGNVANYFGADGETTGILKTCVQTGIDFGADATTSAIGKSINNAVAKAAGGNALVCKMTGLAADKVSGLATETIQNVASNVNVNIKTE